MITNSYHKIISNKNNKWKNQSNKLKNQNNKFMIYKINQTTELSNQKKKTKKAFISTKLILKN